MEVEIQKTNKGKPLLIYRGHEYLKFRENLNNIYWRCSKNRKFHCRASITTSKTNEVIRKNDNHSHDTDLIQIEVRKVKGSMKFKAERNNTTRNVLGESLIGIAEEVAANMPQKSSLQRFIRRKKCHIIDGFPVPQSLDFEIPEMYHDVVLHDSGKEDEKRILALGDEELLKELNAELVLADGTFDKSPELFFQLYSFHVEVGNSYPPVVYFLLPDKTKETYERMIAVILQLCPQFSPLRLLIDFESAVIKAFQQAFPGMQISGCFFHLCQNIIKNAKAIGLKHRYETDFDFKIKVKSLAALAFVPIESVIDVFQQLVDTFDEENELESQLLNYFSTTYIQGIQLRHGRRRNPLFPLEIWNQREAAIEKLPKTTNACEGWHNSLNAIFLSSHPTMWCLFEGIKKDIAIQKLIHARASTGAVESKNSRYKALAGRVSNAAALFDQEDDKLKFLRRLASLQ